MRAFVYNGQPARVVFASGAIDRLAQEAERLETARVLVLCTPEQRRLADDAARRLGSRAAGVFPEAVMHVPAHVAAAAVATTERLRADAVVAVGGGSTTGLGKAVALRTGLPIIAIPTTYAGSEMTPIWGITENGSKRTGRDPRVLPRTVIYDPDLTLTLPVGLSVTSGMNAIAHAVEGLYSRDANPVTDMMAEEGIRALARAIASIRRDPSDSQARTDALYGAWLCGAVLGMVGMALHHKLCHALGGALDLNHGEVHTIVLPHAVAFNAEAAPIAMERIARALRSDSAASGLYRLARDNGAPGALRDIGMKREDIDRIAAMAVQDPYWNPRPIGPESVGALRELLQRAWEGAPPVG